MKAASIVTYCTVVKRARDKLANAILVVYVQYAELQNIDKHPRTPDQ